ncbi:MAG TPA: electron transfer flavoprotein subunit alpha/FixB family protein [Vicinamibacterales bacterium]|nr:electron transfer flavoprotein subunit alpha/FixB family protein [Vicinamibacterales bacterium]
MILVVAEQRDGALNRASWEAITAAQQMAGTLPINVLVPGTSAASVAKELAQADVAQVLTAEHAALGQYTPDAFTMALKGVIGQKKPAVVLMAHTYQARDFAPMLAAQLRVTAVTDVTGISGDGASATFTRPMFQGKLTATVRVSSSPVIVTVQIGAFRADAVRRGGSASISAVDVAIDTAAIRQQPEAPFQEAKQAVDLSQAERIVAVGRGIKSQDNLPLAQNLAKAMGAELAASRPICDSGWLPMERQVGSSGQTVAPRLYVALGISGAIQHLVGMKGSRTIVAINKDADAPIFEVADYGIVGDLFEIVPALTAELEKK